MTVRLLSVTAPLLIGLLAVFLSDLALGAPGVLADDKKNCPAGFIWERWSPSGCVQQQLPGNGKIGYDGYGICEEGYQGIYERRETTDGKPAPGSPYTSFPYLLQCVTPQEFAALEAAGKLPGQTAGGTGDDGWGASPRELAAAGLVAGAAVLAAAGGWIRGGWGAGVQGATPDLKKLAARLARLDKEIAKALREDEAARKTMKELSEKMKPLKELLDKMLDLRHRLGQGLARAQRGFSQAWFGDWSLKIGAALGAIALLPIMVSKFAAVGAASAATAASAGKVGAGWSYAAGGVGLFGTFAKDVYGALGWMTVEDWDRSVRSVQAAIRSADALVEEARKPYAELEDQYRKAQATSNEARNKVLRLRDEREAVYNQYKVGLEQHHGAEWRRRVGL